MAEPGWARFTASRQGSIRARVETLTWGLKVAHSVDSTRDARVFYDIFTSATSFSIGLVFGSHAERERFNAWMRAAIDRLSAPDHSVWKTPIRVRVPSENFDRSGIPHSSLAYGQRVQDVAYRLDMDFYADSEHVSPHSAVSKQLLSRVNQEDSKDYIPRPWFPKNENSPVPQPDLTTEEDLERIAARKGWSVAKVRRMI